MVEDTNYHPADTNGDGSVSKEEEALYLEFKRKELEDADAMRDAQRNMTWFALGGLLLYPFAVVLTFTFTCLGRLCSCLTNRVEAVFTKGGFQQL